MADKDSDLPILARPRKSAALRPILGVLPALGAVSAFLIAWQAFLEYFHVPEYIAPLPTSVLSLLLASRIDWAANIGATLFEALSGFALAVVVGLLLAVALTSSRLVRALLEPLVVGAQLMPKVAVVPILFLWFGLNFLPRVLAVFLICLFPIVIDSAAGLALARQELIDFARLFNPSRFILFRKVLFPTALPEIFAGLKISISLSLVGAVVAEFIQSTQGLGYLQVSGETTLNTPLVFASATLLVLMGFLLYGAVVVCERVAVPWKRSE